MRLQVSTAPYRLVLARPLVGARGVVREREGVVLTLAEREGVVGRGEAAPIAWIDDERVFDAARDLARLGDALDVAEAIVGGDEVFRRAWVREVAGDFCASARAALDAASLDLAARRAGKSAVEQLGGIVDVSVPLNALVVEASPEGVSAAVHARIANGYRTVKLKVGAAEPRIDLERMRAARDALGGEALLRLDANATWSFDVASELLGAIGPERIEYVEEPFADAHAGSLKRLHAITGVPIALDESFEALGGVEGVLASRCVGTVVLKPARVGGPTEAVLIGRRLATHGIEVVLTDAIETSVGRAAVVHAAAALASNDVSGAVGLGGLELLIGEIDASYAVSTMCRATGPGLAMTMERGR